MATGILLLQKITTLACMVLMGFFSVKSGHVKSRDSEVISQLCFDWVIPFSLLKSFMLEYTPETARDFRFACLSALLVVPFFMGLTVLLRNPLRLKPSEEGSLMFTNSAGISLPLAGSLMGSTGMLLCAPHMGTQNFFIFTVLQAIIKGEKKIQWKRILLNRNMISIFVGFLLFVSQVRLPSTVQDIISTVGGLLGPLSMFMIGMLMGEVDFKALLRQRELYLVCALRLLIYPMILILVIALSGITRHFPFMRDILLVMVMCVSAPTATLVTQLASAAGNLEEARTAGSLNVMTSLLCVLTIPLMVMLFQILC